jgi:hypothetical protein
MSARPRALRTLLLAASTGIAGAGVLATVLPLTTTANAAPAVPAVVQGVEQGVAANDAIRPAAVAAPTSTDAAQVSELLRSQIEAGLDCETTAGGLPVCGHGEDAEPHGDFVTAESTGSSGSGVGGGQIGCYGNGNDGPRIRAVYARPDNAKDQYAASLPSIRTWASRVSGQFDASAAATGSRRHVRFATTAGTSCQVTVLNVVLPASAFSSFKATVDALQAKGLKQAHSKYLVWADAAGYCGIATTYADDRPGLDNHNNSSLSSYARVDRKCWGKVETHEVVHMLGGVQRSARNATGGFHCNDGLDVMCYDDRTAKSAQRSVCPKEKAHLLDCRNDDYFSAAPAKGSYLDTKWNTARSSFLALELADRKPAAQQPSSGSSSSAPQPSASPSPSSRSTRVSVPVPAVPSVPSLPAVPTLPAAPSVAPVAPQAPSSTGTATDAVGGATAGTTQVVLTVTS